jgi:hypothetical protein
MMNNLFSAIVIIALVGTFVLAPAPQPLPPSVASGPTETAAVSSAIDKAAAKAAIEACGYGEVSALTKAADGTWRARAYMGTAEVQLTVDMAGRVLPD